MYRCQQVLCVYSIVVQSRKRGEPFIITFAAQFAIRRHEVLRKSGSFHDPDPRVLALLKPKNSFSQATCPPRQAGSLSVYSRGNSIRSSSSRGMSLFRSMIRAQVFHRRIASS